MSRNDNSFNIVVTVILIVIFCISSAISGEPIYLLILMALIGVWYLIVKFRASEPEEKQVKFTALDKIENPVRATAKQIEKKPDYTFIDNKLIGLIKGKGLPIETYHSKEIHFINISCIHPMDISVLINKNPKLKTIRLYGPFLFENQLKNNQQIHSITIHGNPQIASILNILTEQQKLTILDIKSESQLKTEEFIGCCENLWNLTIKCKLIEFPTQLLYNRYLRNLDLSRNKIEKFNLNKSEVYKLKKSGLETLNLQYNDLRNVPMDLFKIKALKEVSLSYNPLTKRCLKKLCKLDFYKLDLSYEQRKIGERRLHPTTWILLKVLFSLIAIAIPYFAFDSIGMSFIMFGFVMVGWTTK